MFHELHLRICSWALGRMTADIDKESSLQDMLVESRQAGDNKTPPNKEGTTLETGSFGKCSSFLSGTAFFLSTHYQLCVIFKLKYSGGF